MCDCGCPDPECDEEYKKGYAFGAEAMRERAAKVLMKESQDSGDPPHVWAEEIRALPLTEDKK